MIILPREVVFFDYVQDASSIVFCPFAREILHCEHDVYNCQTLKEIPTMLMESPGATGITSGAPHRSTVRSKRKDKESGKRMKRRKGGTYLTSGRRFPNSPRAPLDHDSTVKSPTKSEYCCLSIPIFWKYQIWLTNLIVSSVRRRSEAAKIGGDGRQRRRSRETAGRQRRRSGETAGRQRRRSGETKKNSFLFFIWWRGGQAGFRPVSLRRVLHVDAHWISILPCHQLG